MSGLDFGMSTTKACLRAVMKPRDGKSVWTGEYACSVCGMRFRPDPTDPGRLALDFSIHRNLHPAAVTK